MTGNERKIPLDPQILTGIFEGYLRTAEHNYQRQTRAGLEPLILEDSDHNRFLWKKAQFPGLARFVAAKLNKVQYRDRVKYLAAAVVTAAMEDQPTFQSLAKAFNQERWDANSRKQLQRVATKYLPDAIIRHSGTPKDGREQPFATSFDAVPGATRPAEESRPKMDLDAWKNAPNGKYKDAEEYALVVGSLCSCYPEFLTFWILVQQTINEALRPYHKHRETPAYQTLRHPLAVNVLANHAIAICADAWWVKLRPTTQKEILQTPREFEYNNEAAEEAIQHWHQLAKLHEEWPDMAFLLINQAALALQRWGAPGQGALLMHEAGKIKGLAIGQVGNLVANAGVMYRTAGNTAQFGECMSKAVNLGTDSDPHLHLVSTINLGEALGGPTTQEGRQAWASARKLADALPSGKETLWRNITTACQRLNLPIYEEEAIHAWLECVPDVEPSRIDIARSRLSALFEQNARMRPPGIHSFFED